MKKEEFMEWVGRANVIPVYREVLADRETPVGLLCKLGPRVRFLLESVEGGERWGRYSILGLDPAGRIELFPSGNRVEFLGTVQETDPDGSPLQTLRQWCRRFDPAPVGGLPRFWSGMVGYLAYELVHFTERMPPLKTAAREAPLGVMELTRELIIFDNIRHTMKILVNVYLDENERAPQRLYDEAQDRIDTMIKAVQGGGRGGEAPQRGGTKGFLSEPGDNEFQEQVRAVQEYIRAGEVIQTVISRRFSIPRTYPPENLYRALRFINPSPYLFFLRTPHLDLIGSSPEVMVRKEQNRVTVRPIAGTRPRGRTEQEDRKYADDLLDDPKEKAEHVMLVDLGRNDVGRVAQVGTVQVTEYMVVERYSHVMHLVSNVVGELEEGRDCFDVIAATFPAGTLTGAPKVRAMEIIHEMEPMPRGPYGGAVGYIGFNGEMDLGITIRTMVQYPDRLTWQAGAGIVYDSVPERECEETLNKGRAMERAVRLAEHGLNL